jgi:hypothetical protein
VSGVARNRCSECQWRSLPLSAYRCDYAYLAGVTRAAQAEDGMERPQECTHFKKGPRLAYPVVVKDEQGPGTMRRPVDYEKVERLWKEGKTDSEIAKAARCGAQTIAKWRSRNGLEANRKIEIKIDYEKMQKLYDEGLNDTRIAAQLGCSNASVYIWRRERGLRSHWRGRSKKK